MALHSVVRSYGQYCGLAKALDVVGDRWTLLIVRELLIRGGCRYSDLQAGLPGIATNLLAARLRSLERAGLVARQSPRPPVATALFALTPRGEALEAALFELGRWGGPLIGRPKASDAFRAHWLALPARLHLRDHAPGRPGVALEIGCGRETLTLMASGGEVRALPGSVPGADATLTGDAPVLVGVFAGRLRLAAACAAGASYRGDPGILARFQPRAVEGAGDNSIPQG